MAGLFTHGNLDLCPAPCPNCQSEFVYQDQSLMICPECGHEWNPAEVTEEDSVNVKDANGTPLAEGDKVTLIKDIKVKGTSMVLKIGTKAVIKRMKEAKDHQLDCKVDGAGDMMVTAEFVKRPE
ncbi:alkylphosphonate utilization protein [Halomonas sp. TBZ9]|uniref:Alkylphosphonate utilization protein n=1 Tax=Vreelandella azerica TaxID=2732867 RepID=A0A7Y3TXT1_9GAMM|nr:zinc ribbon domain-containing protein YjdM [Halomonas azerica]NOG31432.1 alkylphosphonate utilization protein [Halomonas azerica]